MIFEYIEKLRQKSSHEKSRAAFIGSAIVTSVIFLIWIGILSIKVNDDKSVKVVTEIKNTFSPIASIKEVFSGFFESVPANVFDIKELDSKLPQRDGF